MTFPQLLAHLRSHSIHLKAEQGKLQVRAEKGTVDAELRTQLAAHKEALLALLAGDPAACTWTAAAPRITPEMLPLVQLSQGEIDTIVAATEGGAAAIQDIYPLSPLQEGFLFHHLLQAEGDVYLERALIGFDSRDRLDAFVAALQKVIDRHDILRSSARWQDLSRQVQVVHRQARLPVVELKLPEGGDGMAVLKEATDPRKLRLDLQAAPLLATRIVPDGASGGWLMALLHHHMVCDHVTLEFIVGEVALILGGREALLPPALPYRNFIAQTLAVPASAHEGYFKSRLADVTETTAPFGVLNVMGEGGEVSEGHVRLDGALAQRIRTQAARFGVTTAVLFHVAWARVVALCSGRDDVVFGTVLSGRLQGSEAAGRVLGLFINALPIRLTLAGRSTEQLVRETYADLTALLEHEQASLTLAQQCSGIAAPAPLFTSLLNYRHSHGGALQADGQWDGMRLLDFGERTNYPITVSIDDTGDGFELEAQCVTGIDPARIVDYLATALAGLADGLAGGKAATEMAVLPDAERTRLLELSQGGPAYGAGLLPAELLAARWPQDAAAIAVIDGERHTSYAELAALSNRLAQQMLAAGAGPGTRVGVFAERGLAMVVALLAVVKAGATYLPLDTAHPADRLGHILNDSAPAAVILQAGLETALPRHPATAIVLDADGIARGLPAAPESAPDLRALGVTPADAAYVIYTSGSTGLPKGVANSGAGLVNRLDWFATEVLDHVPVTAMRTSISFVDSVTEVLDTLLAGGTLVVFDKAATLDPATFAEGTARYGISHLMVVPALLHHVLEVAPSALARVRTVITSGERLPPELAQRLKAAFPAIRLVNTYGCSEVNGDATACDCDGTEATATSVIGRPIAGVQALVLDGARQLVPLGATGEIYLGGVGVAGGYLNRPELTAERFVPNPYGAGLLYKTGDLGRLRADGSLEYLGRNDFQVKMRGFRIELGEIEARLRTHPGVSDAVVVARTERAGDPRLAAYVLPRRERAAAADEAGFSLFYFGATTSGAGADKYRLYLEAARFADDNGFEAIWTPERHFDDVAGLYPNPALLSAALATSTRRVHLRAGSVVLPLQQPIRVVEDWSVLDNLTGGRVGVAIASGWHMRDFVLAPEHHAQRHRIMYEGIETVRDLWRGTARSFRDGAGLQSEIQVYPRPVQAELPMWLTSAGANETFIEAGRLGLNLLTHLLGQTIQEVAGKIALYRESLQRHGFDPDSRKVTLMIHTYVGADQAAALAQAREPFKRYMKAHVGLLKSLSATLTHAVDNVEQENLDSLAEHAFQRYASSAAFIGSPESCLPIYRQLREAGVDEFACLFDWMAPEEALAGLPQLRRLQDLARSDAPGVRQLRRHLLAALPDYMVPSTFSYLERMPLTASGKVNRLALPAPEQQSTEQTAFDAPQGVEETSVARLWQDMLNVPPIDRNGNFFELGGHSLLAVQMIAAVGKLFATEVPLRQLFANPTVAKFAAAIREQSSNAKHPNLVTLRKRGSKAPLFLVHPGEGEIGYARNLAPHIASDVPLYGFAATGLLSGEAPLTSIEEIASRYVRAMRSVQPEGPYRIAGWSAGGTIAYEMARQLLGVDQQVGFIGLLDTDFSYDHLFARTDGEEDLAFDEINSLLGYLPPRLPAEVSGEVRLLAQSRDFDALLARMHAHDFIPKGVDGGILQRHLALRHALAVALYRYQPQRLPIGVTLFSASGESRVDPTIGWRAHHAADLLHLIPVSGTHYTIVEEPNVIELGKAISAELARSQPNGPAPYAPRVVIQSGMAGEAPLFCVPGAGASVSSLHELAQALGENVPVHGLQARGLDGTMLPHADVQSAARAYLAAVRDVQPAGPYRLLGHSFGGWIAFEMAQQLTAAGETVEQLVVIDSRSPAPEGTAVRHYTRIETLLELVALYNLRLADKLALTAADFRPLNPAAQLALLHEHLVRAGLVSPRAQPGMLEGVVNVLQANLSTVYRPARVYEGALLLVNASEQEGRGDNAARVAAWRSHAPALVEAEAPGNHLTLLASPHVDAVASRILGQVPSML
ncbi:non-ribosomal peptide synthetase [[Empedobacter] haloabium]|uniref:Non-ribosomal peptide synthetase n=1 Tax=[Empedobacter] haloabium TaxID=592317 RepID=A0ABZ1UIE1_9BURK